MDSVFAITGADFVLVAADSSQARSIVVLKTDEDKILQIDDHKVFAMSGDHGDRTQFCEYIQKNIHLYRFRTDLELSTRAVANFTRKELADALRSNPYHVNLLIAGWDKEEGSSLYYIDYLASMHKVNFAAHGYAAYFLSSLLDRHWKEGMSREEVIELAHQCFNELKLRFLINLSSITMKIVDKDGVHVVPQKQ